MHLIADIGGTNIRLAAFEGDPKFAFDELMSGSLQSAQNYEWDQVQTLVNAISDFKNRVGLRDLASSLTIAIAGPALPEQRDFVLTNRSTDFSRANLEAFALKVQVINDFAAQASTIPHLGSSHLKQVKSGQKVRGARAVLGPGTGLGVAGLSPNGLVVPGEGGNVAVPYLSHAPLKKIEELVGRGQLRAEDVFSGQGLENIFEALVGVRVTAREISARAYSDDKSAKDAMALFFDFAALICANQALQYIASGGVFLVGSIMIKNADLLDIQRFNSVFCSIQTHREFLSEIPVHLVTTETSGLAGVAAYLAAC